MTKARAHSLKCGQISLLLFESVQIKCCNKYYCTYMTCSCRYWSAECILYMVLICMRACLLLCFLSLMSILYK